jgi:arginase
VPRAWGDGGEAMAEAAWLQLDQPEAAVVDEDSLHDQTLALACELPELPVVLGGCCCSHVGAVEGLSARHERLAVVWFDAHGDLNTPATSPSGNTWGMPLRMILDGGAADAADVALVGARELDPPEVEFIRESAIHTDPDPALDGASAVYVAFDLDFLAPEEAVPFMPEAGGPSVAEAAAALGRIAAAMQLAGVGFTGATPDARNLAVISRLAEALGVGSNSRAGRAV